MDSGTDHGTAALADPRREGIGRRPPPKHQRQSEARLVSRFEIAMRLYGCMEGAGSNFAGVEGGSYALDSEGWELAATGRR